MWNPVWISAVQDSFTAKTLFQFIDSTKTPYETNKIRLFRYTGNAWEEYSSNDSSTFEFKAGRLFWVKTLDGVTFRFGKGTALPLSDTITIPLVANGWTDFALPFNFPMYIGDIIAATSDSAPLSLIDSLKFYVWKDTAGGFQNEPFYGDQFGGVDKSMMAIMYSSNGFTVLNPTSQKISLRIPPISTAVSTQATGPAKKRFPLAGP